MITAQERRKKIEAEKAKRATDATAKLIAKVTDEIERDEQNGYTNSIHCNKEVVKYLEALGYEVTYRPAAGMGDVESHVIKW
jgi:hypothetical protein